MAILSYLVEGMRVSFPKGKVAEKNPDRAMTVTGKVWYAVEDGKPVGDPLTITTKNIDLDDLHSPEFAIDPDAGTLTLPAGERGRKAAIGESAESVFARIALLRGETVEDAEGEADADADADAPVEADTAN